MWNQDAIENHQQATKTILNIKDKAANFIQSYPQCKEIDITQFIVDQFDSNNLRTDEPPMVAFGPNTNRIHYTATPSSALTLQPENLILIDLWAGLDKPNAPFADVTWMFYYGKSPSKNIKTTFDQVKSMQQIGLDTINQYLKKKQLPPGNAVHQSIKDWLDNNVKAGTRNNYTGHCLGFTSPHGRGRNLNQNSHRELKINQGYTLEPEIDHEDFGIRLELNFYIDEKFNLHLTTPQQKELSLLQ